MVLNKPPNPRVVLLIALALLPIACSNQEVQKQRHFERGNEYAVEKRDEFAVIEYANAVRLDPKFGEARLKLAEAYERMNNLGAAFPEFVRAADALPDNRDAQIKATQILLLGGRFEDAKARATTLLNKNPKDIDALLLRANALAALKDLAGAITEIEEALEVQPNEGPRTMVGVILETQGKRDEAKRWYEATVAEMSNAPVVANNPAVIYAEEGTNLDVALQLASSAKQQMPDNADVDDTLGWVYYKKDLATMAVRPLEESLKKKPDNADILYHLGLTYAKIGDKAKAREALERALKLNPRLAGAASARQTLASVSQ